MLFTFSLRDGAKDWYHSLPSREFSWDQISQAFLEKFFPLHKQSAARDKIFIFTQHDAGGAITNKTLDDAFLLVENIAFHKFQYSEKPSSELLASCHKINVPQQLPLNQNYEPYALCDKMELAWVFFEDDDAILSDTQVAAPMGTIATELGVYLNDSLMSKPELQQVTFDVEEFPSMVIDDVLLEPEMEEFTFQDVSNIDSSFLEPEMEIFTIDDDEATSDVKEPGSTTSLVDITSEEISVTISPITSPIKVVLKFMNHLRYDFNFLNKARKTIDKAYAIHISLLTFLYIILYRYAYAIGYSIDDLEGIVPITCVACFVLSSFRFMFVHPLEADHVRVDIPWDPGGSMAW
ncbi:unnamed protein product [Alopecurus aequalis]